MLIHACNENDWCTHVVMLPCSVVHVSGGSEFGPEPQELIAATLML